MGVGYCQVYQPYKSEVRIMDSLTLGTQRLVHLDFKGAPPKVSFLEKFFALVKSMGATGVLLEWEDTFPYTRELLPIGGLSNSAQVSGAPYSLEEARQILTLASDCDLTVIPLVQTFGHMEFILKHDQWRGLREVEEYPSSMCPSNNETMPLIRGLIKQIISFHPGLQYIHIGADEIWHMGLCIECSKRVTNHKYGKPGLYLDHVTEVAQYIHDNYPNVKIIMWDDILRTIPTAILQDYYLGTLVEPMIWHYNSSESFQLGAPIWEKYGEVFSNIWAASAFKGATGSCQIVPIHKYHLSNHEAWLAELGVHAGKIVRFRGICLTGWSRYDHYATLCELLPTGIPSLCLCLKTWINAGHSQELHNSVGKLLGYGENTVNLGSPLKLPFLPELNFPGWQICVGFEWYVNVKLKYKNAVESDQMQTWMNQWQVLNNYTNPMQVAAILPVINSIAAEFGLVETYLKAHLEQVFFTHTIEELNGTLFQPIREHLKQIKSDCETQLSLGCRIRGQRRLNL